MTLVSEITKASFAVRDHRTAQDILTHAMTELGELALEIQIDEGKSYKQAGEDGIVGEALDVIICMVDIIHRQMYPFFEEKDLIDMARPKLQKWMDKQAEITAKLQGAQ